MRTTVRTSLYVIPNNKCGVRTNQNKSQTHVIIIDWRGPDWGPLWRRDYLPKTTRQSNTIGDVKAKIDNIKAKIQDKEERRPWSRPTLARHPIFGQMAASPTSSPPEGSPRQVSASQDKSPPRTRSPAPAGTWAQTHSASTTTDARGGTNPRVMQVQQLTAMQAAHPNKSLNTGLTSCAAITSPSSLALPHASSARGTQEPSTTRMSLDSGSGVAS
jgi:hypothetical protein